MKLGDFVAEARKKRLPPISRPVKFRALVVVDEQTNGRRPIQVEALLVLVPDDVRNEAVTEAEAAAPDGAPLDVRNSLREYHFLHRALRDPASPGEPFADTPEELSSVLVGKAREEVSAAYQKFVDEEYPDAPTKGQLDDLTRQAGNA